MTDAPFSNCQFRECDLPGQCRSEGKCHHPRAAGASEGQADGFVFPPMPHAVVQHEKVGPLFDRLSMQFYAAKCMRSQDTEIAALRERIAGMEKDANRINWLEQEDEMGFFYNIDHITANINEGFNGCKTLREAIDAAIDRARQSGEEGKS
jgi:hypothetical protein